LLLFLLLRRDKRYIEDIEDIEDIDKILRREGELTKREKREILPAFLQGPMGKMKL